MNVGILCSLLPYVPTPGNAEELQLLVVEPQLLKPMLLSFNCCVSCYMNSAANCFSLFGACVMELSVFMAERMEDKRQRNILVEEELELVFESSKDRR